MISVGDSEEKDRVFWIGFDSAQALPEDALTERQRRGSSERSTSWNTSLMLW